MNAMAIKPTVMKVIPKPRKPRWNIAVTHLFANGGQGHDGQSPAKSGANAEHDALAKVVVALFHEQ